VARVEVSAAAAEDLERLIRTHSLPPDTKERVKRSVRSLRRFPKIGVALEGRWEGFRLVLGPWRWMLIVYVHLEDEDRVVITMIQDARSASAAMAQR
jgi:plasmid stabilization system protein ParE